MPDTALILIDIQNDYFADGRWPVNKMREVSENAVCLLECDRSEDDTVIHIHHEIPSDQAPFFQPGTPGAEIHTSVTPYENEIVILKHRPNSFHETSLRHSLELQATKISATGSLRCVFQYVASGSN